MRVAIADNILVIHHEDIPPYKKGGAIVRNTYFWALKSIACYAPKGGDWEFDTAVWVALKRILLSFRQSGYLRDRETLLEFPETLTIPEELRAVASYL